MQNVHIRVVEEIWVNEKRANNKNRHLILWLLLKHGPARWLFGILDLPWVKRFISCNGHSRGMVHFTSPIYQPWEHINGLVQDCSNSIANALELLQSCTKPSIWNVIMLGNLGSASNPTTHRSKIYLYIYHIEAQYEINWLHKYQNQSFSQQGLGLRLWVLELQILKST